MTLLWLVVSKEAVGRLREMGVELTQAAGTPSPAGELDAVDGQVDLGDDALGCGYHAIDVPKVWVQRATQPMVVLVCEYHQCFHGVQTNRFASSRLHVA